MFVALRYYEIVIPYGKWQIKAAGAPVPTSSWESSSHVTAIHRHPWTRSGSAAIKTEHLDRPFVQLGGSGAYNLGGSEKPCKQGNCAINHKTLAGLLLQRGTLERFSSGRNLDDVVDVQ